MVSQSRHLSLNNHVIFGPLSDRHRFVDSFGNPGYRFSCDACIDRRDKTGICYCRVICAEYFDNSFLFHQSLI